MTLSFKGYTEVFWVFLLPPHFSLYELVHQRHTEGKDTTLIQKEAGT